MPPPMPMPRICAASAPRGVVLALVLLALRASCGVLAACAMTQKCVRSDVDDKCMPEAHPEPLAPLPMRGDGWANVTGGAPCATSAECHRGTCLKGTCHCREDGVTAGASCDQYAIQCPEYKTSACCTWQQNQGLAENFQLLAAAFGQNEHGGCDACAANLMQLWCGLVCAPNQAEFMHMHAAYPSTNYRPDPMSGRDHVQVLEMNVSLRQPLACAVFASCKHTALASSIDAMKSSLGFLNYQAQVGAIGHGEFLFLRFNDTSSAAFDHPMLACANYSQVNASAVKAELPTLAQRLPSIARADAIKQCPCGSCRATCDASDASRDDEQIHVVDDPISVWSGFHVKTVTLVYAAVLALVVSQRWRRRD